MNPSTFGSSVVGSSLVLLTLGCSSDVSPRGALMLSITTDMSVPNDIDHVFWSVTLEGETIPFQSKVETLASGTDLPLTLAIEAGPKTTGPITVRVEGRRGAATWLVRAAREATVVVPTERVAKLELPLSWLCSGANLPEPCAAGTTCQAGYCVDAAVATESLPDFEPSPARDCYDVTKCLAREAPVPAGPIMLKSGRNVLCGLSGVQLGPEADVNLALQVKNERVGNYGFCGPLDDCLIPLQRGEAAENWRVLDNGDIPTIELPLIVCENSNTSIAGVAVVQTSLRCPADLGDRPLCPPPEKGCLEAQPAQVCPATFPMQDWVGYTCTDVSPLDQYPDLLSCWPLASPAAQGRPPEDGRWCCLKRGLHASDDPLLIDDMQGGPQIKLAPPEGHLAGWWEALLPEGNGDLSPAPKPSLYTYRQFDEPVGQEDGPKFSAAACLSSKGFHGWVAMQGFFFGAKLGSLGADTRDVSEYAGISFWGWAHEPFPGSPLGVSVGFPDVQTSEPNAECSGMGWGHKCDNFFEQVSLTGEWKHYVVRWENLAQSKEDWGQMRFEEFKRQIRGIYFTVGGAGPVFTSQPFDFCIADLRFEPKTESTP
jgi:hypothetical protein